MKNMNINFLLVNIESIAYETEFHENNIQIFHCMFNNLL